jgi:CubicO group peptidase (beta-lactamase class C family)
VNRINNDALETLVEAARASRSTALAIWQDGGLAYEWWFHGRPRLIETMSVTKSVVNLIVGRAVTLRLLEGADTPVHEFYPEWRQGKKRQITVRHLLSHTSGLQDERNTTLEIYPSPDFVKLALAAELEADPGSRFFYSNKAVNLLAGVIHKASGKTMLRFAREELFARLEFEGVMWSRDEAGNPHGMSGLQLQPRDLLKLGRLALEGGVWNGERLIRADWLEHSLRPGNPYTPSCGWLWWLKNKYSRITVSEAHVAALERAGATSEEFESYRTVIGEYNSLAAFWNVVPETLHRYFNRVVLYQPEIAGLEAFYGDGYLGQYVVVLPEHRLVAVRMLEGFDGAEQPQYRFDDFMTRVLELVSG